MPDSAAKKAWIKENTITISLRLNKNTDADLIDYLNNAENRHGTIKNAIRAYIAAETEEK